MNQQTEIQFRHFFYISNILSLLRVPCAIAFIYFLNPFNLIAIIIVTILGVLTDYGDGYFARRFNQVTKLGIILDPLADKIAIAIIAIALLQAGYLDLWICVAIIARDVVIIFAVAYLKYAYPKVEVPMSNKVGKVAVNLIAAGALLQLTQVDYLEIFGMVCIVVGVVTSFLSYARRFEQLKVSQLSL